MSKYVYQSPIERGYKQFKLTKNQHNRLFPRRQIKWIDRYEYYYNEHEVILHKFYNWKAVLLQTIAFPLEILLNGIRETKEIWRDIMKLYNQKKYGKFIGDSVSSKSERYNQIMTIVNKENK